MILSKIEHDKNDNDVILLCNMYYMSILLYYPRIYPWIHQRLVFFSITHFIDILLGYLFEHNFRHHTLTIQFELMTNAFSQLLTFNSDYKSLRGSRRRAGLPKTATYGERTQWRHQRHAIVTAFDRIHT